MPSPSGAASPRWRPPGGPGRPAPGRRRTRVLLVLAGVALALGGVLAAWPFFLTAHVKPHFRALVITEYSDPHLPRNPWARQDGDDLRRLPWNEKNTFDSQTREKLLRELDLLQKVPAGEPVVVYVSGFALTNPGGEPCLLAADSWVGEPATWLPISQVLKHVADLSATHKLLLLDVTHPYFDPGQGVLVQDAAERLDPLLEEAVRTDPHLLVLTACSPGQRSLASEELGHTVFGYYLLRGLRGRADGWRGGPTQGRVTVRDLAHYVRRETDGWARANRGTPQNPEFYGTAKDFALVRPGRGERDSDPSPTVEPPKATAKAPEEAGSEPKEKPTETKEQSGPGLITYLPELKEAWEVRDRWWKSQSYRLAPGAFRELEAVLLRHENRWRGGDSPGLFLPHLKLEMAPLENDRRQQTRAAWERWPARLVPELVLQKQLDEPAPSREAEGKKEAAPPPLPPAPSLAWEMARRQKEPEGIDKLVSRVQDLAALAVMARDPKAKEEQDKLAKKLEDLLKEFKDRPFELAWAVYQAAVERSARPEHLPFLASLVGDRSMPPYKESGYLQGLAERVKDNPADWPADGLRAALVAAREAEKIEPTDPRDWPWVKGLLGEAREARRQGEELLFSADKAGAVAPLQRAGKKFQDALQCLQVLQSARLTRDQETALLPGYLPWLEVDPESGRGWERAVAKVRELHRALEVPGKVSPDELARRVEKVEELTESLRAVYPETFKKIREGKVFPGIWDPDDLKARGTPVDGKKVRALLEIPALGAGVRAALWSAWHDRAQRLHQEYEGQESASRPPPSAPEPVSEWETKKALEAERSRALARAGWWVEGLRLAGVPGLESVDGALGRVKQDPSDPAAWKTLAEQLRAAGKSQSQVAPPGG